MSEDNRKKQAVNHVLTEVLGRVADRDGGRITGRVIVAGLVVLGVAGLAFVAYRLLMLDLILTLVGERD